MRFPARHLITGCAARKKAEEQGSSFGKAPFRHYPAPFRQRDIASHTAVASRAPRTTADAQCRIQDATPSGVPDR